MNIEYAKDPILNELFNRTHRLMDEKRQAILSGEKNMYSLAVHELIMQEYSYGIGYLKRSVITPMPKEQLEKGRKRSELKKYYSSRADYSWPVKTFYQYSFNECNNESQDYLMFGYAIYGEELLPCAFFMNFLMTFKIPELPGQLLPEEYAIDYMGLNSSKSPECYIGIMVPVEQTEEWMISGGETIFPLEYLVQMRNKESRKNYEWEKEILMGQQESLKDLSVDDKDLVVKWLMKNQ